jgi:MHS family proline/betaine transporter-like MFS transporter
VGGRHRVDRAVASLFPTEVRGGALSIAFNVSVSLFAGIIGAVSIWFTLEPNGRHMWGSSPAAATKELVSTR